MDLTIIRCEKKWLQRLDLSIRKVAIKATSLSQVQEVYLPDKSHRVLKH